ITARRSEGRHIHPVIDGQSRRIPGFPTVLPGQFDDAESVASDKQPSKSKKSNKERLSLASPIVFDTFRLWLGQISAIYLRELEMPFCTIYPQKPSLNSQGPPPFSL